MTNIFQTSEKKSLKDVLFETGMLALKQTGWTVTRTPGIGGSSVRQISKGREAGLVSIRTSQDTWIAFPRDPQDQRWVTLSDVDFVLAVSVDNKEAPRFANAHFLKASEVQKRFDRAYDARRKAGYSIPLGRGLWLPLYFPDAADPVTHVGGGLGIENAPIMRIPLDESLTDLTPLPEMQTATSAAHFQSLSIPEAKRRLALSLGVEESKIRIIVEG